MQWNLKLKCRRVCARSMGLCMSVVQVHDVDSGKQGLLFAIVNGVVAIVFLRIVYLPSCKRAREHGRGPTSTTGGIGRQARKSVSTSQNES